MPYIEIILWYFCTLGFLWCCCIYRNQDCSKLLLGKREGLNKGIIRFSTASLILRGSIVEIQVYNMCYNQITGFRDTTVTKLIFRMKICYTICHSEFRDKEVRKCFPSTEKFKGQ